MALQKCVLIAIWKLATPEYYSIFAIQFHVGMSTVGSGVKVVHKGIAGVT